MGKLKNMLNNAWEYAVFSGIAVSGVIKEGVNKGLANLEEQDSRRYKASFGDETKLLSSSHTGFTLTGTAEGRMSRSACYTNLICIGNIGSGKTSALGIPQGVLCGDASMVVTDPSGQFAEKIAPFWKEQGKKVKIVNFDAPFESDSFNPLAFVLSKSDAYKVAYILVSFILKTGTGDNFWFLQAHSTIYLLICLVMTQPEEVRNFSNVRHLLKQFMRTPASLDKFVSKYADQELFEDWVTVNRLEEKVLKSVLATCQSALQLWFDDNIAKATSVNTISFEDLRKEPTLICIRNATMNSKIHAPLLSMFFEFAFKSLMSRLPDKDDLDVFMILDEIGTLRLDSLPDVLNNNRKYRFPIMTLWQSYSIAEDYYGIAGAESIRNASRTKVYLSGMGLKESNHLEELLGKEEYEDSEGKTKVRPLLLAQDIRAMKCDEAIIISGTEQLRVTVTPYFKQPLMMRKLDLPPFEMKNGLIPHSIPYIKLP